MMSSSLAERRHQSRGGGLRPDRVAGEVPRGMLAEVAIADSSRRAAARTGAEVVDEQHGVVAHDRQHPPSRFCRRCRPAGEHLDEIAEQPRAAEATASDDHAVATGLAHHPHGVIGCPDAALPSTGIAVTWALSSPMASQRFSPA